MVVRIRRSHAVGGNRERCREIRVVKLLEQALDDAILLAQLGEQILAFAVRVGSSAVLGENAKIGCAMRKPGKDVCGSDYVE